MKTLFYIATQYFEYFENMQIWNSHIDKGAGSSSSKLYYAFWFMEVTNSQQMFYRYPVSCNHTIVCMCVWVFVCSVHI